MSLPVPSEVGIRLRRLADDITSRDEVLAQQVHSLADAMADPAIAAVWLDLDPLRVLTSGRLTNRRRGRHVVVRVLEAARNAAMLVPIVVTWLAVGQAVTTYGRVLSVHPELSNQTFLYLWQTGFDHAPNPGPSLGFVAFLDVGIVLSILGLMFVLPLLDRWLSGGGGANVYRLEAELQAAAADASLCLPRVMYGGALPRFGRESEEPAAGPAPADEHSAQMAVIRAAASVARELHGVVAGQAELNRRLTETLEMARVASQRISDNSDAVRGVAETLVSGQTRFIDELTRQSEAQRSAAKNLGDVSGGLARTLHAAETVEPAMRELATYLSRMNDLLPRLLDGLLRTHTVRRD